MRTIDADALIDYLQMIPIDLGYREVEEIEGYVRSMPTIEPEREKGKWIRWHETKEDETGTEYIPHCRCSECGTEYDPHSSKFVSFCNVCGAKMEEEVNRND